MRMTRGTSSQRPRRPAPRRAYHRPSGHLLDVRVRARTARKKRREKILKLATACIMIWAILAGIYFGGREFAQYFLFQNSEYSMRKLDLQLGGIMTRAEFLKTTGVREGDNLFKINLDRIENILMRNSSVESARVERDLPDRLSVAVTRRTPVAWAMSGTPAMASPGAPGALLVADDRTLMTPPGDHLEFLHLPVMAGLDEDILVDGGELTDEDALEALELLRANAAFPDSRLEIRSLDVSKGYRIDVTNESGARITFATDDFDEQLTRLNRLLQHSKNSGREIESVQLLVKKNMPVKFVMPEQEHVETRAALPVR